MIYYDYECHVDYTLSVNTTMDGMLNLENHPDYKYSFNVLLIWNHGNHE